VFCPDTLVDAKATAARRWVAAVNAWGGLGSWEHAICYDAAALSAVLDQQAQRCLRS
jgi:hypothetical protein